jgi:hypothetical protein
MVVVMRGSGPALAKMAQEVRGTMADLVDLPRRIRAGGGHEVVTGDFAQRLRDMAGPREAFVLRKP